MKELVNKTKEYLVDVKDEMRKVVWPSKNELYNSTVVVLLLSFFLAVFLGAVDLVFEFLVKIIFKA